MELLDQKAVLFLVSWGNSIVFSTVAAPVCIPTNSALGFPILHLLSNTFFLLICLWWPFYTDWKWRVVKKYSKQMDRKKQTKKKCRVAILTSDKIDFKTRAITRDPEGHFIIILHFFRYEAFVSNTSISNNSPASCVTRLLEKHPRLPTQLNSFSHSLSLLLPTLHSETFVALRVLCTL